MSFTQYKPVATRLQRSELACPGSNPSMIDKAAASKADFVFLDLEDAVAPNDKEQARKNIIEALNDIDWKAKGKTVSVRINGLDTHYMYRDVVDVVEQAGARLDTILIPKVGTPHDVYMVEAMVTQIEEAKKLPNRIGLEALIETAIGMANVEDIARQHYTSRLEALHFGVADFAASRRSRTVTSITCWNSTLSATALTGRLSASRVRNVTTARLERIAPRQRRGRKGEIGVSASSGASIGRIGPCAERL